MKQGFTNAHRRHPLNMISFSNPVLFYRLLLYSSSGPSNVPPLKVTVHFSSALRMTLKSKNTGSFPVSGVLFFSLSLSAWGPVRGSVMMERRGASVSAFKRERRMDRVRMRPPTVMCPHSSDTNMWHSAVGLLHVLREREREREEERERETEREREVHQQCPLSTVRQQLVGRAVT